MNKNKKKKATSYLQDSKTKTGLDDLPVKLYYMLYDIKEKVTSIYDEPLSNLIETFMVPAMTAYVGSDDFASDHSLTRKNQFIHYDLLCKLLQILTDVFSREVITCDLEQTELHDLLLTKDYKGVNHEK